MKTLIPILLFITLALTSCEKSYCWQCTTFSRILNKETGTTRECDYTEDEIRAKEKARTDDTQYYFCKKDSN
jgi:hypothetical protein